MDEEAACLIWAMNYGTVTVASSNYRKSWCKKGVESLWEEIWAKKIGHVKGSNYRKKLIVYLPEISFLVYSQFTWCISICQTHGHKFLEHEMSSKEATIEVLLFGFVDVDHDVILDEPLFTEELEHFQKCGKDGFSRLAHQVGVLFTKHRSSLF